MGVTNRARSSTPARSGRGERDASPNKQDEPAKIVSKAGHASEDARAKKSELRKQANTLLKGIWLALMFFCFGLVKDLAASARPMLIADGDEHSMANLKTWVTLPVIVASLIFYLTLSTFVSKKALFYSCIVIFLGLFIASELVSFPRQGRSTSWAEPPIFLQNIGVQLVGRPLESVHIWATYHHVVVDLWGSAVVPIFFWGLANKAVSTDEAKLIYPWLGHVSHGAHIFSGRLEKYLAQLHQSEGHAWVSPVRARTYAIVLLGIAICGIYGLLMGSALVDHCHHKAEMTHQEDIKQKQLYFRDFSIVVLANVVVYSVVEQGWQSKELQESEKLLVSKATGGAAKFGTALFGVFVLRHSGWGVASAITPTLLLGWLLAVLTWGGASPHVYALGHIICTNALYTLAYPCKQMAYLPLDEHSKARFKAMVDVVGSKYGGVLVHQLLLRKFGPQLAGSSPYVEVILVVSALAWLISAASLNRRMHHTTPPSSNSPSSGSASASASLHPDVKKKSE